MAELIVRAHYESNARAALLAAYRFTFPLWGVVMPVALIPLTFMLLTIFTGSHSSSTEPLGILAGFSLCTVVPIIGLISVRLLSNDSLILSQFGLKLPSFSNPLVFNRSIPWENVFKVQILGKSSGPWRRKQLLFYRQSGAPIKIDLSRISAEQLEQILLAIDIWGLHCERDPQLQDLAKLIHCDVSDAAVRSYTEMWEEELQRRFCSAVFMPLESGQILRSGSLRVVRPLALGGFSAVYLCQLDDKRLVVLKESVVPEDSTVGMREKALELFEREAHTLMKLKHPNIVKVLDYFVESGRHYMLLEYASGQDLRQYVKQNGPVNETVVLDWAVQVVKMMKYLHEQEPPILHRDLTPDNLVLKDDGSLVLIDFGAANEFLGTATGTFVGKQAFISPEQFRGKAVIQSDIYAFGGTLHYLLTGLEPEALSSSCPRDKNPNISEDLNEVVESCTQMEVSDRFQSAAQLLPVLTRMNAVRGAA
jgi:predicted Ser/Thr protein kinase